MKTLTLEEFHFELRDDRVYESVNFMTFDEVIKLSSWLNNIVKEKTMASKKKIIAAPKPAPKKTKKKK